MASHRMGRTTEDIKRELTAIFRELKDPRVQGLISIVRVDVTSDLSYCTVFVSAMEGMMKVYYDLVPAVGDSAVALGSFDGLHIGHKKVISTAVEAKKQGLVPTVLTFAHNPLTDLGGSAGGEIITQEQKIDLLEKFGVEQLYILKFSAVKDLSAEEFVDRILAGVCRAKEVCCGFNFTFGCGGKGDSAMLSRLCAERGIKTAVTHAVLLDGEPVSSTRIRSMVGTSIALSISDIPWKGPISGVSVGYVDGQYVINPTSEQRKVSQMAVTVASTDSRIAMSMWMRTPISIWRRILYLTPKLLARQCATRLKPCLSTRILRNRFCPR